MERDKIRFIVTFKDKDSKVQRMNFYENRQQTLEFIARRFSEISGIRIPIITYRWAMNHITKASN